MMEKNTEKAIAAALRFEWEEEGGFFFDYRDGKFNEEAFLRAYRNVLTIDFSGEEKISKELVALIYDIPFFLICNEDLVLRRGGSRMLCEKSIADFAQLLMDKLQRL
jgi:hypothetical protein